MAEDRDIDPSEFVQRIRQLGEQHDQHDAERVKKLEEELMQGRSERLARRAERARSISPDKPSTPQSPGKPPTLQSPDRTPALQSPAMAPDDVDTPTTAATPTAHDDAKPATSAAALGRSGTLSWKQRPKSGSMRRPLSMAAPSTSDRSAPSSPERPPSRSHNAPSQPRLSRDSIANPDLASPSAESTRSSSPTSRGASVRGSTALSNRFSSSTSHSGADLDMAKMQSPLPVLESQKFAPPTERPSTADSTHAANAPRGPLMSPTQGRISPERERPASPTKGMGGFVLSASMKRSDSVSKRWSTQAPPNINRQSSTLSNRASAMAGFGSLAKMDRPTSLSRESSVEPLSRPMSSSNNLAMTKGHDKDATPKEEPVRPSITRHSRSKSMASTFFEKDQPQDESGPASPSKRWSPTKSSWLESALNKPESPKPKPSSPVQPAWMAEINRIKQQRSSVDLGRGSPLGSPFGEASRSRPSSPIKDVQLRPTSLRKLDYPVRDDKEPQKLNRLSSPKLQPAPELKPSSRKEEVEEPSFPPPKKREVEEPPPPKKEETEEPQKVEVEEPKQEEIKLPEPAPSEETPPPIPEPAAPAEAPPPTDKAPPSPTKPVLSRFVKDAPHTSPAVKPKPETLPKNDFRATLKSRQHSTDVPQSGGVSELQNVFGKLRKTETKNFVAPDVLKDNILRGKKSLNLTSGPKPTVRRDEFRESLISTKSSMLVKASETGSTLKRSDSISKPVETPEAIAAQNRLSRSKSISKPASPALRPTTPEAIARKKSLRGAERPVLDDKPAQSPVFDKRESAKPGKLADRFNPALAGLLSRGPPAAAKPSNGDGGASRPAQDTSKPAPELQHMTKGRARGPKRRKQATAEPDKIPAEKIPEKVNATVAAALPAKPKQDPPSSTPSSTNGTSEEPLARKPTRESITEKPLTPVKPRQLSAKFDKVSSPELPRKPDSLDLSGRVSSRQETSSPRPESVASPRPESPMIPKKPATLDRRVSSNLSLNSYKSPILETAGTTVIDSPKPVAVEEKSPDIHSPALTSPQPGSANPALQSRFSRPLPTPPTRTSVESLKPKSHVESLPTTTSVDSPKPKSHVETPPPRDSPSPEKAAFSVRSATALWGRKSVSNSPVPSGTRSPIKLPTRADEQAAMKDAGLVRSPDLTSRPDSYSSKPLPASPAQPRQKPAGLGFNLASLGGLSGLVASRSRDSNPPTPRDSVSSKDLPLSPPGSVDMSRSDSLKAPPAPKNDGLFAEFFDEAPVTEGRLPENIDTVHILKTPPFDLGPTGKIRTLRKQMQEVTGDGKLYSVSMQEEHVLFQDSMYICTHVYEDSKGAKHTDVYLWAGNSVPEPTVEDVQVFARTHAKQNQARLLVLRQGNEPPNFFEALGGIVITRRGAKPASKEYMLCGRRHLGHLAFDEVDFSLQSFCSAFPYLISTTAGKVFLWKGRGCSAEELSGARLMGMDLAPTGDFEEVTEGTEPASLIAVFPPSTVKGPAIPRSADHWRFKATSERYRARLFKMEQQPAAAGWGQSLQTPLTPRSPVAGGPATKVVELMPFCQRDLEPEHIYVLDAFFELYIIIGALARSQAPAFGTALLFAQEYGILAVSEEDRPFMPVTTIVLEGVPRDMKAVFRHWSDASIATAELMTGRLNRKSLRIVGLERAIRETRR